MRLLLVVLAFLLTGCATLRSWLPEPSPQPVARAWTLDGSKLAVGLIDKDGASRVEVFDRNGLLLSHRALPGKVLAVAWSSRGDLLAAGYRLQHYSFGANLSQWLFRSYAGFEETLALGDVTIETATVKAYGDTLPQLLPVAFSPSGDELVYARLHDPPQFPPYLQLLYRNWQVATTRRLIDLPVMPVTLEWLGQKDTVVCRSDDGTAHRFDLWPTMRRPPAETESRKPLPPLPEDRLWTLRKWRFEGLITADEFVDVTWEGRAP